jgi:hypothetical protein
MKSREDTDPYFFDPEGEKDAKFRRAVRNGDVAEQEYTVECSVFVNLHATAFTSEEARTKALESLVIESSIDHGVTIDESSIDVEILDVYVRNS